MIESKVVPGVMLPPPRHVQSRPVQVGVGPGLELANILASIGIQAKNCPCKARMQQMNQWGVSGCNEHFNEIVGWMRDGQHQWGWADKLKAAALAFKTGLAFQINPFDPFPGLVSEAIRRADAKQPEKKKTILPVPVSPVDLDTIEPQLSLNMEKTIGKKLSGRKFNSSAIPWKDGYAIAFRLVSNGNDNVYISILDQEMNERSHHRLDVSHRMCSHRREDPRFFWHRGKWWVSIIGVQIEQKWVANQLYVELDDDLHAVPGSIWCPDYSQRLFWEKNWTFFDHEGQLYAVYNITPHTILRIDRSNVTEISKQSWSPKWSGGLLRGGASPVLVGDEYYSFFHGRIRVKNINYYTTGCYTFAAEPPFEPRRITPKPFLSPCGDQWFKPTISVLFTCGAFLQDGRWILTSGVHDKWTQIDWIDAAEIERRMILAKN